MKIRLFQELLALNEEFGHVIHVSSSGLRIDSPKILASVR